MVAVFVRKNDLKLKTGNLGERTSFLDSTTIFYDGTMYE
jgi:hypothetical protein